MNFKKKHNVNGIAAPRMNFIRKKECAKRELLSKNHKEHTQIGNIYYKLTKNTNINSPLLEKIKKI